MIKLFLSLFLTILFLPFLPFFEKQNNKKDFVLNLSEYGFFEGSLADQKPNDGIIPYALNTPLFSDYAEKLRFVKIPEGKTISYNSSQVLEFPIGTILIKTFYFPFDFRDLNKGRKLIETRLLIHEEAGWKSLVYVWNEDQTDAILEVAGDTKEISYLDKEGKKHSQVYLVPNLNQCKGCHNRKEKLTPIGPTVRQLNGEMQYKGEVENQLTRWSKIGILKDLPDLQNCPKAPVWNKPETGSLDERARAYLDINCAHCHNPEGPAMTSGLNLSVHETNENAIGINKSPVAAGRGSGGRDFDIIKGKPDKSILLYRMESTDPGILMPEIGRKVAHKEGIALVKEWIKNL